MGSNPSSFTAQGGGPPLWPRSQALGLLGLVYRGVVLAAILMAVAHQPRSSRQGRARTLMAPLLAAQGSG
jgi:hypothetical protein